MIPLFWRRRLLPPLLTMVTTGTLLWPHSSSNADPDPKPEEPIINGYCATLQVQDIPEIDLTQSPNTFATMPESEMRITQGYNTDYAHGYWSSGGQWMYGHDGIDIRAKKISAGITPVVAIKDGVIIATAAAALMQDSCIKANNGWGETVFYAMRIPYSHQILVFENHHLHYSQATCKSSRKVNPCEQVKEGQEIAKEGETGAVTGPHLHFGVRVWDSFDQLSAALKKKTLKSLTGTDGYVFSNTAALKSTNHLDPYHLLYEKYTDLECTDNTKCAYWARAAALQGRRLGLDFGRFDGTFGTSENLTKAESARWLKVGQKLATKVTSTPTYTDVPVKNPFFPYVETLITEPDDFSVLNKTSDCDNAKAGNQFCLDAPRTRAEFLKMVILGYLPKDFDYFLSWATKNPLWKLGKYFVDVEGMWAKAYVLFAAYNPNLKLIKEEEKFRPNDPITRAEAIYLQMLIQEYLGQLQGLKKPCDNTVCYKQACLNQPVYVNGQPGYMIPICYKIPGCAPKPESDCEYGGGTEVPPDPPAQCSAGQTMACGNCGSMSCGPDEKFGPCENQGICSPGQTNVEKCLDGLNSKLSTCTSDCSWNITQDCPENPQPNCECNSGVCCDGCHYLSSNMVCGSNETYQCAGSNPGDDAQRSVTKQFCPGNGPDCTGTSSQGPWLLFEDCSEKQKCVTTDSTPMCQGFCTESYTASSLTSCFNNPATEGKPNLCMYLSQKNQSIWSWQVCKSTGDFTQDFKVRLVDNNHSSELTTPWYQYPAGKSCSDELTVDLSYLQNYPYGTVNGAGLKVEVLSPKLCVDSDCQYSSGSSTVTRSCE